jgi:hypothetical protein
MATVVCKYLLLFALVFAGCGGSYEETVAGVKIPVPRGMKKSQDKGLELSLAGFAGGQSTFKGNDKPESVIEFYSKEMPARGWKQSGRLASGAAMLSYVKENKTAMLMVGRDDAGTVMTITVSGTSR